MKKYENTFLRKLISEVDDLETDLVTTDQNDVDIEEDKNELKLSKDTTSINKIITILNNISDSIREKGLSGYADELSDISKNLAKIKNDLDDLNDE